jgi:hypothetical protein
MTLCGFCFAGHHTGLHYFSHLCDCCRHNHERHLA